MKIFLILIFLILVSCDDKDNPTVPSAEDFNFSISVDDNTLILNERLEIIASLNGITGFGIEEEIQWEIISGFGDLDTNSGYENEFITPSMLDGNITTQIVAYLEINPDVRDTVTLRLINQECELQDVRYSNSVWKIIDKHCYGCHLPISNTTIDLNDYEDVRLNAANGSLLGSLLHLDPYSPMPKDLSPLSECEIAIIRKWIQEGYKE